jgi:uncharacterized membrane protein HdeD (DUF308 family)
MTTQSVAGALKHAAGLSVGFAVLMIAVGLLSIALPQLTGMGVAILVAWITIFGGVAHLAYAFAAESAGTVLWRLLIGVVYIVGGIYLAANPGLSLVSLTLVLAGIFFAEGLIRIVFFFQTRPLPGATWILTDGVLTVLLGFLIVRGWPASSTWAIGTIVGINLCVSGVSRLMFSMLARRALKAAA